VRVVAVLALQIRTLREVHADEAADERLIDHLGAGGDGADDSDLSALLAALRDEVDR
jgi:hypothetical protein